jgi:hypothetical protein
MVLRLVFLLDRELYFLVKIHESLKKYEVLKTFFWPTFTLERN